MNVIQRMQATRVGFTGVTMRAFALRFSAVAIQIFPTFSACGHAEGAIYPPRMRMQ
jgi:hypothetical protein